MAANSILSTENAVKFATLLLGGSGLYFAIKSDIRDINTVIVKDKEFTEYRLNKIEDCCGGKHLVINRRPVNLK